MAGGFSPAPGVFSPSFDRQSDAEAEQFSQELQLLGEMADGRLNFILGGFYFLEEGSQTLTDNIPLFGLPQLEPTFLDIETNSYAAFAQASYTFDDRLTATLGLRYTEDNKRFDASIQSGFGNPPPRTAVSLDETFTAFTPKFGLDYRFSDALFGYLSVSRGFKAGGFNGLAVLNPAILRTVYDPQSVWAYEAGIKTEPFDRRARFNVAVFLNDISDLQQTGIGAGGSFPTQNVGSAELFGVEAEFAYSPVPGLNLFSNVGYQDGRYTELIPGASAALANAEELPLVTDWTVQAGFTYEGEVGNDHLMRLGLDGSYVGDHFVEVTNVFFIEGYTRYNAFVSAATRDSRWELKFQVQNLTDEPTVVSGIARVKFPRFTRLRPRTWLLSLNYTM